MALICFMDSKNGSLCQVKTGEGKTTIVSALAILKMLQGNKYINICTSNDVLAAAGYEDQK